jgi:uncharacterized protein YprB with RNaseH-like and TPR domain
MSKPRVLFLDVETSPIKAYTFGIWNVNIGLNQIIEDMTVISVAWRWSGDKKIHCVAIDPSKPKHDKKVIDKARDLLNEAQVVVAHNLDRFDMPILKGRMFAHSMKPITQPLQIDTLKIARRHFKLTSNKLEHLANVLNLKHKKLTIRKFDGMALWTETLAGNKAALKEMKEYNMRDVDVLEHCYNALVPWEPRINFDVFSETFENTCTCGSTKWHDNGHSYKMGGVVQKRYACAKCGKERKTKKNLLLKEKKASL